MKSEVKKLDGTKREILIEADADVVKNKFEDVFKQIAKEAKVPGFRPGHAPRDLLEKHYSAAAHEQVIRELIPELYNQAIEKENLDVIELPDISEVKLDKETLSFKATVEISPQIALKDYKKLKVNYKKVEVAPDEVKRNLDTIKESRKMDSLDDKFANSLGYPNLAELEKAVERQIFIQKENQQRQMVESQILEQLTKDLDFKIPESLIKKQEQDLLKQAKVDLAMRGFPKDKIEEQEKSMLEKLAPQAKDQVKVYLVLAEVAKREKIPLDDHMPHHVIEFLLKEADWKEAA